MKPEKHDFMARKTRSGTSSLLVANTESVNLKIDG